MAPRSRDNRSPTTFWFDDETKAEAKDIAKQIDTTLTELINEAVEYYLENKEEIHEIHTQYTEKGRMKGLAEEVAQHPQLKEMERRLDKVETQIEEINDTIQEIVIGDEIQSRIKSYFQSQIAPVTENLGKMIERLSANIEDSNNQ